MGSGGGSSTSVDYAYNARMAAVAEQQSKLAMEQYYATSEASDRYTNALHDANTSLIPAQTEYSANQLGAANALLPAQTKASQAYYDASVAGVNIKDKMAQAQADAVKAITGQESALRRNAARSGVDINSGAFAKQATANALSNASAIAAARTGARTAAEEINYNRLAQANQSALSGIYS